MVAKNSTGWERRTRRFPELTGISPRVDWILGPGRRLFFKDGLKRNGGFNFAEVPITVSISLSVQVLRNVNNEDEIPVEFRRNWPGVVRRIFKIKRRLELGNDNGEQQSDDKPIETPYEQLYEGSHQDDRVYEHADRAADVGTVRPARDSAVFVVDVRPSFFANLASLQESFPRLVTSIDIVAAGTTKIDNDTDPFVEAAPDPLDAEDIESGDTTVVVGLIDDGIAFAHDRFRSGDDDPRTRIEYLWIQDPELSIAVPDPRRSATAPATAPAVASGYEWTKQDIDALMADCSTAGQVEEDAVYRKAGVANFSEASSSHKPHGARVGHGTHVLDLFSGYDRASAPDDRPIVCVQLPRSVTATPQTLTTVGEVERAVEYIFQRADQIARQRAGEEATPKSLPLVINFSYGNQAGPHDGQSALETFLDAKLKDRSNRARTVAVLPSGNAHLARGHARMVFEGEQPRQSHSLKCRVLPDDRTPSFVQIWFPKVRGADSYSVTITSPNGHEGTIAFDASAPPPTKRVIVLGDDSIAPGESDGIPPPDNVAAQVVYEMQNSRPMVELQLQSTNLLINRDETRIARAPAGDWLIEVERSTSSTTTAMVELWIERDDAPIGFPRRGRQSYFHEENYDVYHPTTGRYEESDRADNIVKRGGNLNAIATGSEPIVVAAYLSKEREASRYSAGGPASNEFESSTVLADRRPPDLAAAGDESRVHTGVLAAGTRSGSRVLLQGTSMAAPQVARRIAEHLAAKGSATRSDIISTLVPGAGTPPAAPPAGTEAYEQFLRTGYGLVPLTDDALDPPGRGRLSDSARRLLIA